MAKGLIDGQRRWWPGRADKTLDVLAYGLTEYGGNVVQVKTRWGYEIGCMGLNHNVARETCDFWQIKRPASTEGLLRKLKRDHRWCAYLTYGALVMNSGRYGGDVLWGVARTKLGTGNIIKAVAKYGNDVAKFPMMPHFIGIRSWLACIEDWQDCGRCLKASHQADFPIPSSMVYAPPSASAWCP